LDFDDTGANKFVALRCPFHDDHEASAGFDRDTGVFNCYACVGALSPGTLISKLTGVDLAAAWGIIEEFRREHNLAEKVDTFTGKRPKPSIKWDHLVAKAAKQLNADNPVVREYCGSRGVAFETLQALGIGLLGEK
jgi:hypothetical protein